MLEQLFSGWMASDASVAQLLAFYSWSNFNKWIPEVSCDCTLQPFYPYLFIRTVPRRTFIETWIFPSAAKPVCEVKQSSFSACHSRTIKPLLPIFGSADERRGSHRPCLCKSKSIHPIPLRPYYVLKRGHKTLLGFLWSNPYRWTSWHEHNWRRWGFDGCCKWIPHIGLDATYECWGPVCSKTYKREAAANWNGIHNLFVGMSLQLLFGHPPHANERWFLLMAAKRLQ